MLARHYSDSPVGEIVSRENEIDSHWAMKPRGFWISFDDDHGWKDWCMSEHFGLNRLTHVHEVDFDASQMLVLNNQADLERFTKQYSRSILPQLDFGSISWNRVAQSFTGILIPKYLWECRLTMHLMWYYGWDCASGCIWERAAINSIKLVEITPVPEGTRYGD